MNFNKQLKDGLIYQNPVLVQVLGMCSTMAITTSVANGFGMGISVLIILTLSNIFISLLRKIIPNEVRIACYIVVIAGFVTIVDLCLQAFFPDIAESLGVFIPLIVVNCIILARAEAFASSNKVGDSILDGLGMGLGFTLALTLIGFIRELLGNGTIFAGTLGSLSFGLSLGSASNYSLKFFVLPAGGFMTLGILMAAVNAITDHRAKKKQAQAEQSAKHIDDAKAELDTATENKTETENGANVSAAANEGGAN